MVCKRAALFRGRQFTDEIIVLCVHWYALLAQLSRFDGDHVLAEPHSGSHRQGREVSGRKSVGRGNIIQPAWWCRRCYDRERHSRRFFGGHRESVLTRDSCCQLCLAKQGRVRPKVGGQAAF